MLAIILIEVFFFLLIVEVEYNLNMTLLSDLFFVNIFSQSGVCLFIFLTGYFD